MIKVGPAGLEPPAGVRKRRKATVKNRRNPAPGFIGLDGIMYHEKWKQERAL